MSKEFQQVPNGAVAKDYKISWFFVNVPEPPIKKENKAHKACNKKSKLREKKSPSFFSIQEWKPHTLSLKLGLASFLHFFMQSLWHTRNPCDLSFRLSHENKKLIYCVTYCN